MAHRQNWSEWRPPLTIPPVIRCTFPTAAGTIIDPALDRKSGAYGFNDVVNPNDAAWGCPNQTIDTGEDLGQTGTLELYGGIQNGNGSG